MREILFRGKRIDNGEWVFGMPWIFKDHACVCPWHEGMCKYDSGYYPVHVIPETVWQYTGLNDKNGKKIFEGDIVDCWSEGVNAQGTVQQRKDGMWIIYPAWQKTIMWGLCPDEYCKTTVEVIGNIHDNPEMIGGAEDGE